MIGFPHRRKGEAMRWVQVAGVVHGVVGGALFFGTLHPLRDLLGAHELMLVATGSAFQLMQGLVLLVLAGAYEGAAARLAAGLIAAGAALSMGMLAVIAFAGAHPFDPAVPIGGGLTLLGWIVIAFARRRGPAA